MVLKQWFLRLLDDNSKTMANDNLLATLENTLRQTRASRARLASRLVEIENEAVALRAEMSEMDAMAAQTEATMYRFMSAVLGGAPPVSAPAAPPPTVAQTYNLPIATPTLPVSSAAQPAPAEVTSVPPPMVQATEIPLEVIAPVLAAATSQETKFSSAISSGRFADLTIPQATAALLRETGGPLHVNDIFARLEAGGFVFSGHNPTISIAVSLNRNARFRKVSPGTFALSGNDIA